MMRIGVFDSEILNRSDDEDSDDDVLDKMLAARDPVTGGPSTKTEEELGEALAKVIYSQASHNATVGKTTDLVRPLVKSLRGCVGQA